MNARSVAPHLGAALVLALVAVLFAPTLGWLVRSWLVHPYYSHGLLMPFVAAWLVWRARGALTGGAPSDAGLALIAVGVLVHLAALRWAVYPLSALGGVLVLLGMAVMVAGWRGLRALAFPAMVLALAVPLPMVERLAPPLAAGVARAAAGAAGLIGVAVVQAGAQLAVADGAFTVGAPCSGLRSLVALGTLAVVLAGTARGPWPRRAALVFAALPLALAANWARLTGLLWAADAFGVERGLQLFHSVSGPVLFIGATACLVGACRALGCDVRSHD